MSPFGQEQARLHNALTRAVQNDQATQNGSFSVDQTPIQKKQSNDQIVFSDSIVEISLPSVSDPTPPPTDSQPIVATGQEGSEKPHTKSDGWAPAVHMQGFMSMWRGVRGAVKQQTEEAEQPSASASPIEALAGAAAAQAVDDSPAKASAWAMNTWMAWQQDRLKRSSTQAEEPSKETVSPLVEVDVESDASKMVQAIRGTSSCTTCGGCKQMAGAAMPPAEKDGGDAPVKHAHTAESLARYLHETEPQEAKRAAFMARLCELAYAIPSLEVSRLTVALPLLQAKGARSDLFSSFLMALNRPLSTYLALPTPSPVQASFMASQLGLRLVTSSSIATTCLTPLPLTMSPMAPTASAPTALTEKTTSAAIAAHLPSGPSDAPDSGASSTANARSVETDGGDVSWLGAAHLGSDGAVRSREAHTAAREAASPAPRASEAGQENLSEAEAGREGPGDAESSSDPCPCQWYICDDDATNTRYIIVQVSRLLRACNAAAFRLVCSLCSGNPDPCTGAWSVL